MGRWDAEVVPRRLRSHPTKWENTLAKHLFNYREMREAEFHVEHEHVHQYDVHWNTEV